MFKNTVAGDDLAENPSAKPGPETKVVGYLYLVSKPVELEELADQVKLADEKLLLLLRRMINEQLIEEV